jgi:hypothetical protein
VTTAVYDEVAETSAAILIDVFAPRTDVYNVWTGSQYVTLHEPLTADVVLDAAGSGRAVGAFFPGLDGTSKAMALDIDRPDGGDIARRVGAALAAADVPSVIVDSEDGHAHLWVPVSYDEYRDTTRGLSRPMAQAFMRGALNLAGVTDTAKIELRPDGFGGDGHALRLPTMPHPDTGRRFPMLDGGTGERLGSGLDWIANLNAATRPALIAVAERVPLTTQVVGGKPHQFRQSGIPDDGPSARDVLAGLGATIRGRAVRCPFHEDRVPSGSLSPDGLRYWCHADCIANTGTRGMNGAELARLRQGTTA